MNIISNALGHVLRIIFELVQNYGLSIILFTIVVKVLLLPLTIKQTKSTKAMQDIQPKILEIQTKYKDKPEKQQQEIMKIYTEAKINPLAGCLPLLIQMPILIALFSVLREPVTYGVFVDQAQFATAAKGFLWIKDLTTPDVILAVLSGATTFLMQTLMMPKDQQQGSMKMMTYFMPLMSAFLAISLPSGLGVYWIATAVIQTIQTIFINRYYDKIGTDKIVEKNVEKRNKKRAKKGLPAETIVKGASVSTKNVNNNKNSSASSSADRAKKLQERKEATGIKGSRSSKR